MPSQINPVHTAPFYFSMLDHLKTKGFEDKLQLCDGTDFLQDLVVVCWLGWVSQVPSPVGHAPFLISLSSKLSCSSILDTSSLRLGSAALVLVFTIA
jgi:hypothetical protein